MAKQIQALVDTHGKTVMSTFVDENKLELLFSDGTMFRVNLKTPAAEQQNDKSDSERTGAKSTRT